MFQFRQRRSASLLVEHDINAMYERHPSVSIARSPEVKMGDIGMLVHPVHLPYYHVTTLGWIGWVWKGMANGRLRPDFGPTIQKAGGVEIAA
jgi:hypothetical protein